MDKHKEKLAASIKKEVTSMFETILDYSQIACTDNNVYKVLRSRILRTGNNCIRNLQHELSDYDVKYNPPGEDVINIKR